MAGFVTPARAIVVGASGGIGGALVEVLAARDDISGVIALSRSGRAPKGEKIVAGPPIDMTDPESIAAAFAAVGPAGGEVRLVIVASGLLSDGEALQPEKSYRHQSLEAFRRVFDVNTFGPALVAGQAFDLMPRQGRAIFAALSARVGSISDNRLGGWHAYRASKAALNMLIRNYAIEQGRKNSAFIAVGLHPGTVDTGLSRPFQGAAKRIFTPQESASHLVDVIAGLKASDSGGVFDWDGEAVPA